MISFIGGRFVGGIGIGSFLQLNVTKRIKPKKDKKEKNFIFDYIRFKKNYNIRSKRHHLPVLSVKETMPSVVL
jgi:hypothetical protein